MAREFEIKLRVAADGQQAVTEVKKVNRSVDDLGKKTKDQRKHVDVLSNGFAALGRAGAAAIAAIGFGSLVRGFVDASAEADRFRRGFEAVSASSAAAAAEIAYVSEVSQWLGLELSSASSAYLSLTAAARGTELQGEQSRRIFEAVSLAMGKLGKSAYDTEGALLAIEQMISKGTVQAEELRGQLGERLPGAFQAAANAMGVTTAELGELLQKGEVTANELLPKLATELNRLYEDGSRVGGLAAEWNRFTAAMREFAASVDEATGALSLLESILRSSSNLAGALSAGLKGLGFQGIADQQSEFNLLLQKRIDLVAQFEAQAKRVNELSTRSSALEALFPQLPRAQSELRALGQELGEVERELAAMQQGQVDLAKAQSAATAETERQTGAATGWSESMVDATARVLGWGSGIDSALSRLQAAEPILRDAAKSAKIPEEVLLSVFALENAFGRVETSGAGAKGAMQFMDGTAAMVAKQMNAAGVATGMTAEKIQTDLTAALQAGAFHLADLSGQFDHFYEALIAYNAGPGRVGLTFAQLPKETQDYVRNGIALMEQYAAATGSTGEIAKEVAAAHAYMAGEVDKAGKSASRASRGMTDQERASKAAAAAMGSAIASAQQLTREYIPGRAAAEDYAEAQRVLAVAVAAGKVAQEDATAVLAAMTVEQTKAADRSQTEADVFAVAWERAVERIDDGFASLWEDLFTGSKNAMEAIRTGLRRWLAELAHMLTTQRLTLAIGASVAGTGTAAAGQAAAGGVESAQSVGYLAKISSMLTSNSIGEGMALGASKIAGMFGRSEFASAAYGRVAGMPNWQVGAAGAVGGLAGGFVASKMFEGEYVSIGSTIGSAVGTAAAPMIAAALGMGPVGWVGLAVGAFIGAIGGGGIGSLFGGERETPRITLGVRDGNFAALGTNGRWSDVDGGGGATSKALAELNNQMWTLAEQLGPGAEEALRSFRHAGQVLEAENFEQWLNDISQQMLNAMATGVRTDAIREAGDGLLSGIMSDLLYELSGDLDEMVAGIGVAHQLEKALKASVESAFNNVGGEVFDGGGIEDVATRIFWFARETKRGGEGIADALMRVTTGIDAGVTALKLVGDQAAGMGVQEIYEVGEALAIAADGYEALNAGMSSYYDLFFSEEEKRADQIASAQRATSRALEDLGLSMPESAAGFRSLVDSLDLTTEWGQEAFVALTGLSGQFRLLFDVMEDAPIDEVIDEFLGLRTSLREMADEIDPRSNAEGRAAAEDALSAAGYTGGFDAAGIAEFLRALAEADEAGGAAAQTLLGMTDVIRDALAEAARVAEERAGLELQLLKLTGTEAEYLAEVRRRELEGLDASNRAIQERIWALEDEAAALREAEELARSRTDLEIRLAELQGNSGEALRMRREMEIAATHESLRELLYRIYALEDEAAALKKVQDAASEAYQVLERSVQAEKEKISGVFDARMAALDAERSAVEAAHQSALQAIDAQREASQEALSAAQGALSSIQSALSALRGQQPVDEFSRARAQRDLSGWAASGRLPEQEALDRALDTLSRTQESDFGTEAEFRAAQGTTYANLLKLEKAGVKQVDYAEATVDRLDAMIDAENARYEAEIARLDAQRAALEAWRDAEFDRLDGLLDEAKSQLDALMGIDNTLLSIDEAMRRFLDSLQTYRNPVGVWYGPDWEGGDKDFDGSTLQSGMATAQSEREDRAKEAEDLRAEIAALRKDLAAIHTAQVVPLKNIDDRLRKFDLNGMPPTRDTGETGQTVVLLRAG